MIIAKFPLNLRFNITIMERMDKVEPTKSISPAGPVYSGSRMDQNLKGNKSVQVTMMSDQETKLV